MQTGGLPKATRQAQNGRAPVSMESGMFESEIMKPRSGFARLNQVKLPLWVTLVLLIVFLGLFAAREFTLRGREDRVNDERRAVAQQLEVEQAARRASTRHVSDAAYQLFGKAFAWAVRSALLRRNLDEIEQYFAAITANPQIRLAVLVDQRGKILLASDRQLQDAQFTAHFPAALLETTDVAIQPGDAGQSRLVLPIQGLNRRLGTVLVIYTEP
jgi:hypothetical protein